MDHLTRFFLELEELRRGEAWELELPAEGGFVRKTRRDEGVSAADTVQTLETLWDRAMTVTAQREGARPSHPLPHTARSEAAEEDPSVPFFGSFLRREDKPLTAEALSRFFERDARRYGKGE